MAHIERWYQCPVCDRWHDTPREAQLCRNNHPVREARWAVGTEKSVRISERAAPNSLYGEQWALREADLSDFIEVRKQQLECEERKKMADIVIRMLENVRPDLIFLAKPGTILRAGKEYEATSNKNGAISGRAENGEMLGVRPGEFEFVRAPQWLLDIHEERKTNGTL